MITKENAKAYRDIQGEPASEKQVNYIAKLRNEVIKADESMTCVYQVEPEQLSKEGASDLITDMKCFLRALSIKETILSRI